MDNVGADVGEAYERRQYSELLRGVRERDAEIARLGRAVESLEFRYASQHDERVKAQDEIARLRAERNNAETVLACVADSMNTYLREENAEEVTKYRSLDLRDGLDRLVWAMRRRHRWRLPAARPARGGEK